jgi:hypothetical protein
MPLPLPLPLPLQTPRQQSDLLVTARRSWILEAQKDQGIIAKLSKVKRVSEMDALELGYAAAILKDGDVEVDVPIPKSYRTAVNDAVYGP